jgi:hypothetical protein
MDIVMNVLILHPEAKTREFKKFAEVSTIQEFTAFIEHFDWGSFQNPDNAGSRSYLPGFRTNIRIERAEEDYIEISRGAKGMIYLTCVKNELTGAGKRFE